MIIDSFSMRSLGVGPGMVIRVFSLVWDMEINFLD
jgi:hypothetical protein